MKETLTCTRCEKKWKRDKVRGRKPYFCLSCAAEVAINLEKDAQSFSLKKVVVNPQPKKILVSSAKPKTASDDKMFKPPTHWQCPACSVYIGVEVAISEPPAHRCPKRANRVLALEQIPKKPKK